MLLSSICRRIRTFESTKSASIPCHTQFRYSRNPEIFLGKNLIFPTEIKTVSQHSQAAKVIECTSHPFRVMLLERRQSTPSEHGDVDSGLKDIQFEKNYFQTMMKEGLQSNPLYLCYAADNALLDKNYSIEPGTANEKKNFFSNWDKKWCIHPVWFVQVTKAIMILWSANIFRNEKIKM